MDKDFFEKLFLEFTGGIITDFSVDLCGHLISISFYNETQDRIIQHYVIVENVSSFYFVGGDGENRFQNAAWQYAELTSISYLPGENMLINRDSSYRRFIEKSTSANFVLEIWSASLLIEANSIVVDGQRYVVGYSETK